VSEFAAPPSAASLGMGAVGFEFFEFVLRSGALGRAETNVFLGPR